MTPFITDKSMLAPHSIDGINFWAVIIGIDDYKTSPLRGCVSDAMMVFKHLSEDLHVHGDHIQLLLSKDIEEHKAPENQPPTRANIVNAILHLSTNPDIQHGDNIIIYFAGHGTTYKCDDYAPYQETPAAKLGNVEALCPLDRSSPYTTSTKTLQTNDAESLGPSDPHIPDISDREMNVILTEIARNKGDHITFIVDCCHSAGVTRAPREGVPRSMMPLQASSSISDMFRAADEDLRHRIDGYQSISVATWTPNMDTHVILAACKDFEEAKEREGNQEEDGFHGIFTQALIPAFKSAGLNDKSMTYYRLIEFLPRNPTQNPVIAGKNMHSRLWFQDYDSTNIEASLDPLPVHAPSGASKTGLDHYFPSLFWFFCRSIELFRSWF